MTEEEKFTFDLEGYLVIKNVLIPEEIDALSALADECFPDRDPSATSRVEQVSKWGEPTKNLIDHPKIVPYLVECIGPRFRIDHDYCIFMNQGNTRGRLHGGHDPNGDQWYSYRDGEVRNSLCAVIYFLADASEGDGGFCCIPGSHKTNFRSNLPEDVRYFERIPHYVVQPPVKAGDALFFTEALIHGTLPWRARHERKTLLYKYSPGHTTWAREFYDPGEYGELSEQQQRVMHTPSAMRDHPDVVQSEQ